MLFLFEEPLSVNVHIFMWEHTISVVGKARIVSPDCREIAGLLVSLIFSNTMHCVPYYLNRKDLLADTQFPLLPFASTFVKGVDDNQR